MEKCRFDSKQDMYKVLDVECLAKQSEPHEYVSEYNYWGDNENILVKQAKSIAITKLIDNANIETTTDHIKFHPRCIQKIGIYKLGTQEFYDFPTTLSIDYTWATGNVSEDAAIAK